MLRLPRCDRLLAGPGQQSHAGADRPTTLATGRRSPRSRRTTAQAQLTTNSPHFAAHDPRHGERPSSTSLFAKTPLDDLPSDDIIPAAHTVRIRSPPRLATRKLRKAPTRTDVDCLRARFKRRLARRAYPSASRDPRRRPQRLLAGCATRRLRPPSQRNDPLPTAPTTLRSDVLRLLVRSGKSNP